MKTKAMVFVALLALICGAFGQSKTITINGSTGAVNVDSSLTPIWPNEILIQAPGLPDNYLHLPVNGIQWQYPGGLSTAIYPETPTGVSTFTLPNIGNANVTLSMTDHAQNISAANTVTSTGSFTFNSGAGLTLNGTLNGTPTGGTFSLANVTLTLPTNQAINITVPGGATRDLKTVVLEQMKTPQDYGAVADGSTHPLSGSYASLALAQAAYPFSVTGCSTTSSSTTVTCDATVALQAGYPISGTGIPAGATVASITDGTTFVLSAAATATNSGLTLTSSFVTSTTQEKDWAGAQAAVYANGSIYFPPGVYIFGSSTLRTTNPAIIGGQGSVRGDGITINGAGPQLTSIQSTGDAIHVLGRYQSIKEMSINGPGNPLTSTLTDANGITLGEDNYLNNFKLLHANVTGFNRGLNNPGDEASIPGWDACSVENCYFDRNFIGVFVYGNQDRMRLNGTTIGSNALTFSVGGASTTNGSATVTVASTDHIQTGCSVSGTNIPAYTKVLTVTDATHFVMSQNATGTGSGITLGLATMGVRVTGGGAVNWDGGVSGGNGVSVVCDPGSVTLRNLHLELADQTYLWSNTNSGWTLDNVLFQDGGGALVHLECYNGSVVHVANSAVGNSTLGHIAPGLVYVLTHGAPVYSPDHTAVQDWYGAMQVIAGDCFIQGGDNAMPSPSAAYRGKSYYQGRYASYSGADHIYTCQQLASGSYAWIREDGLVADTGGVVKTITAGGTTGAQTINFNAGSVNFAAAATSLVVTDSLVTANSVIMATVATNDATLTSVQAVPGAGSFTLYGNAAATAETRVQFLVIPQ